MWLRLLVPFILLWPVLALTAEGTSLRRYRGGAARELLAVGFATLSYFALWTGLDRLLEGLSGSVAAGIVGATLLSLLAVGPLLFIGFKLCGVKRGEPSH